MPLTASEQFLEEVARFKAWAASLPPAPRGFEWECDYEHWGELYTAVARFLDERDPAEWTNTERDALLYAVARDNEDEIIAGDLLKERPRCLFAAARATLGCDEPDAKWQLADALTDVDRERAHPMLEVLAHDADEYVSRRALLALGRIRSPLVEVLADRAWATGHEYQRIATLHALFDAQSPRLKDFLTRAAADGRKYLVKNAEEIRARIGRRD